jgi:hypothetical protein
MNKDLCIARAPHERMMMSVWISYSYEHSRLSAFQARQQLYTFTVALDKIWRRGERQLGGKVPEIKTFFVNLAVIFTGWLFDLANHVFFRELVTNSQVHAANEHLLSDHDQQP